MEENPRYRKDSSEFVELSAKELIFPLSLALLTNSVGISESDEEVEL